MIQCCKETISHTCAARVAVWVDRLLKFFVYSRLHRENVKSRNSPRNRQKRRKTLLFLIKCLLLPLYYSPYTRMCNKSQISSPFKNGKASLQPSIPFSPEHSRQRATDRFKKITRRKRKISSSFLFLRFTTVTQPAKVQQTTSTRRTCITAHLTRLQNIAQISLICFLKVN